MHLKSITILFIMYLMIVNTRQVSAQTTNYSSSLNNYSFDLYREIKVEKENLFLSPLSTYCSLLMVYEGSKNKTKQEFEKVLHIKGSHSLKNNFFNDFGYNSDSSFVFNVSNAIWLDQNLQVKAGFKQRVTNKYFSDLKQTEFANTLSAISDINGWVSEKTNGRINEIVNISDVNSDTKLLISNAVYFKGEWLNKFEKQKTNVGLFYTNAENQCKVDFMKRTEQLQYFENEEYQFISKPYKVSDMSFCIILPKKLFGIEDIEKKMNNDFFDKILDNTYLTKTSLSIPKFNMESSYVLNEALKNAGLKSAFSSHANFSGITTKAPLMLGNVLHKTWFEIDEEKTEAAAATAVTIMITGRPSYKVFTADHPFVFFIIDNRTRAIIFMGRYVEPINGEKILEDEESLTYNLEDRKKEPTTVGSNNRLLIIAGKKIITQAELKAINPENVESFKILKDKGKISKYTSENYDGVIVITLKKKRKNKKSNK